ncbi:MAG: hypothetical protein HQ567_29250 [Candidatus Nealsonbacteria bacterium]|nr:hypothetical protein [Candidatus Nealsonbacteria bacterium]
MAPSANITSIDTVETLATAVKRFQTDAANVLDDLGIQVHRAQEWVQHDRKQYWAREVHRNSERVAEAKINLQRAMTMRRLDNYQPACREEKKELEKARHRLRVSEEKAEAVKRWSRAVDQAVLKYKSGASRLAHWLEADAPKALAVLGRLTLALEAYMAVQSPVDVAPLAQALTAALEGDPSLPPEEEEPPNDRKEV